MIDYEVRKTRQGLRLKMDAETAHSVMMLLDLLVDMTRDIKRKAEAKARTKDAQSKRLQKKRIKEFDARSMEVFEAYEKSLDVLGNHQAARMEVKINLQLKTFADVDIYLMRARKLSGKPKFKPAPIRAEPETVPKAA